MVDWITPALVVADKIVRLIRFARANKNTAERAQCRHSIGPKGVHDGARTVALSSKQARLSVVLGRWDLHLLAHRTHLD